MKKPDELIKDILKARYEMMLTGVKPSDMELILPECHYNSIKIMYSYATLEGVEVFPMTKLFGMDISISNIDADYIVAQKQ